MAVTPEDAGGKPIELANPQAGHSQARFPVANALKGEDSSGWAVAPKINESHTAVFETRATLSLPPGSKLVFALEHHYKAGYLLQRFRLSATGATRPLRLDAFPTDVSEALAKGPGERTGQETALLRRFYTEQVDAEARKLKAALDEHDKKAPKGPETFAAIMTSHPGGRTTQVHMRGNFMDKGVEVQPAVPSVLHPMHPRGDKPDRLDLARWLFDPANPLTARVAVNHVWKNLFGRALVATVDDFGTRGERPSHPELLDWLAAQFQELGWSLKDLIRLIVTSATYKQSSLVRPELESADPTNVLLARQNRLRMEAETVRDASLAASGLLSPGIGGPSVKPPLPPDIAALGYANSVKWVESSGTDKYRRGLYIFFQRTVPFPMLMTFDAPDSNATCTRRERSNTPLQALTLLNDPEFFECARSLGGIMADAPAGDMTARLQHGFLRCMARPPSPDELGRLEQLHAAHVQLFKASPAMAAEVCGSREAGPLTADRAAWVATARIILNLDEFITRN